MTQAMDDDVDDDRMEPVPSRVVTAYRAASTFVNAVPEPVARAASRALGTTAALPDRRRRLIVARNLRRVHGPGLKGLALQRAVQRTFESYARYWMDAFRLPSTSPAELDFGMTLDGYEHVEDALAEGHGPLMILPHLGGWEWAAFWITAVMDIPVTAVVERLEPPELYEWFVSFRSSLGMNVVPLGPSAGTEVSKAVKRGEVVCLLTDRDIDGTGVEVEFFGETTTLPKGPAMLALRTGAPLLPCAIYYEGESHHGVVRPPVPAERTDAGLRADVTRVTQALAYELEELIRRAPEQWHLMQPNWPSDHEALANAGL